MDADPWADAPSTPRLDDATPQASPSHPSQSSTTHRASTSSPPFVSPNGYRSDEPSSPANGVVASPEVLSPTNGTESGQTQETSDDGADDAGFDDFDDFDESAAGPSTLSPGADAGEDGFGDFGDFEEGDEAGEGFEEGQGGPSQVQQGIFERDWAALRLDPFPSASSLRESIGSILLPLASSSNSRMTDEPPREVGGLAQIMVSESSREAYAQLTTPPMLKSLDWTRSRVRREHLISMGVPVNLDEVDSHRLSSLPPLRITTTHGGSKSRSGEMGPPPVPRPASVDGRRYTADQKGKLQRSMDQPANGRGNGSQSVPPSATPRSGTTNNYGLDPRPSLDLTKAENLCGLDEGALSLISLEKLRAIQDDLVDTSAQASAVLAWLLQLKDAQAQDSATYNGMISELIANAAKAKQAQSSGSGGVFRRSSLQQGPQSSSGTITPRRTGSPAIR